MSPALEGRFFTTESPGRPEQPIAHGSGLGGIEGWGDLGLMWEDVSGLSERCHRLTPASQK